MPKAKKPKKMGRPKIEIDWKVFDGLCHIQATKDEIASMFKCSHETIENKCHETWSMSFSDYYKIKSEGGKISLRRRMYHIAMSDTNKGSPGMCIWLSKQQLGMRDKYEDDRFKELVPLVIETTNGKKTFSLGKAKDKDESRENTD